MLTQEWEAFANALANAPDSQTLSQVIEAFVKMVDIPLGGEHEAKVSRGRDTRPSGDSLFEAVKEGVASAVGSRVIDVGLVTTPQLHWMVRARNKGMESSEHNYNVQLSSSFRCLLELIHHGIRAIGPNDKLIVEGANGVGGEKIENLKKMSSGLCIEVRNCDEGELNEGFGTDNVGFGPADVGNRCASLDGDADRLVYFLMQSKSDQIDLVDSDKIMALFALFVKRQLSVLDESENAKTNTPHRLRLRVVQTAYANGAATDFLKQLGLEVVFTPIGVKHLNEKVAEYDIGIYFEANGHETILFLEITCPG